MTAHVKPCIQLTLYWQVWALDVLAGPSAGRSQSTHFTSSRFNDEGSLGISRIALPCESMG